MVMGEDDGRGEDGFDRWWAQLNERSDARIMEFFLRSAIWDARRGFPTLAFSNGDSYGSASFRFAEREALDWH